MSMLPALTWRPSIAALFAAVTLVATAPASANHYPFVDTDGDGLDDNWEVANFGNLTSQDQFGDPDADGANNLDEYTDVTDPLTYDGPNAPTAVSPVCGSQVVALQTVMIAANATDPQGTPLKYEFALYSDAGLTIEVAHSQPLVDQGAGATTEWAVGVNLLENSRYYWRARARDQYTFGPWSAPACAFFVNTVNEPPTAPRINSPAFGAQVHTFQPNLIVDNADDPEQDTLRYVFEIFLDPALSQHIATSAPIVEGAAGTTSWIANNVNPPFQEDHFYYWRARACDPDGLCSAWSATSQFFVTTTNTPPEPPSIVSPQNGAVADGLRPPLVILNADDADLDPLVYDWDVALDVAFTQIVATEQNAPPQGAQSTTFTLPADLAEDTRYCWRVRSDDGQATSPYHIACFLVSETNAAPPAPVPQKPADTAIVTTTTPVFSWEPARDPEGDAVTYDLEVRALAGEPVSGVFEVSGSLTPIPDTLVDGETYLWRLRASDRLGAASAWSDEVSFTVAVPRPWDDGCCDANTGCSSSGSPASGGALGVGVGLGLLLLRRRRR